MKQLLDSHVPYLKMLPEDVHKKFSNVKIKTYRKAGILVPIIHVSNREIPSILFTLRSSGLKDHSREICFPGGHFDEDDKCLINTAIREAKEELSPSPSYNFDDGLQIVGIAGDIPSARLVPVTPVLGYFKQVFSDNDVQTIFPGNESEVSRVFTLPIDELFDIEDSERIERLMINGPVYRTKYGKIWGLTGIVLKRIMDEILRPVFIDEVNIVHEKEHLKKSKIKQIM